MQRAIKDCLTERLEFIWAAVTKYHKLGGISKKHLFLTILETGKFKIKVLADPGSGEGLFLVCMKLSSHLSSHGGERGS